MRRCVVLLLLGVAACSSGHPRRVAVPVPSPTPAAVAPVIPSPTPEVLRFPATKEGAKAIAKAYFEQANLAEHTGDTSGLRALVDPACECVGVANYVEKFYPTGERHVGNGFRLKAVRIDVLKLKSAIIAVTYDFAPSDFIEPDGRHKPHSGRRAQISAMTLDGSSGAWRIAHSTLLQRGSVWPP